MSENEEKDSPRGFLYFLPGVEAAAVTLEHPAIIEAGLDALLKTVGVCINVEGPEGQGLLFAGAKGVTAKYQPKKQVWLKGPKYWVGYWKDARPRAVDLERAERIPGYQVTLEGDDFVVPLARIQTGGTMLPELVGIDGEGKRIKKPLARYARISQFALDVFETIVNAFNGGDSKVDEDALFEIAVEALSINYHVGAAELTLLEVLTTTNMATVAQELADIRGYLKMVAAERGKDGENADDEALDEKNVPAPTAAG